MRRVREQSKLWAFLNTSGVLESGDEARIKAAKKEYWKLYDAKRKRKLRKEQRREIVLAFPGDEINHVRHAAKLKGHTLNEYIRACVRADMRGKAVIPHPTLFAEILQVMQQCNNQLDAIKKKDTKGWLIISRTYDDVETILKETLKQVQGLIQQPKDLRTVILESLQSNPNAITILQSILQTHDNKV